MIRSFSGRQELQQKQEEREQLEREIREKIAAEQQANVTYTTTSSNSFIIGTTNTGWYVVSP